MSTVIRRYSKTKGFTIDEVQRFVAPGAVQAVSVPCPGVIVDVSLDNTVALYDVTTDEYMGTLGYVFVAEDPAQSIAEAGIEIVPLLDTVALDDHGNVDGPVTLDMGASLNHKMTLTGNLGTDDITVTLPTGPRTVTVEVAQGGVGEFTIADDAWTGVDWGTVGPPVFGDAAGVSKIVVLYCNGAEILGFANANAFGP